MNKKIVLHLGIHKTATTSLQEFLGGKRTQLRKLGVAFTPLDEMRNKISPLIRSRGASNRRALRRLVRKSRASVMLWSDENLLGAPNNIKKGKLYPLAFRRLKRLCKIFSEFPIEVIICVRSPEAFILSAYSEFIRHQGFESFESFTENFDIENLSFARVLSWSEDLPANANVTILPFEEEYGGGISLVTETILSKACGEDHNIPLEDFPKTKSRSAFSVEELQIGRTIAEASNPLVTKDFLRMIGTKGHRFGGTKFNPIDPSVGQGLLNTYLEDLDQLCAHRRPTVDLRQVS